MPVLTNSRRERFVQGIISGATATAAYIGAGYSKNGAAQSAQRLLKNVEIQARKAALEDKVDITFVAGQIAERQYRLTVIQDVVDRLRMVIDERAAAGRALPDDLAVPGAASGLLVRRERVIGSGKAAIRITEWILDAAAISKLYEGLKQAAIETGDWEDKHRITEDRGPDYSHLSVEELREQTAILAEAKAKLDALGASKPASAGLLAAAAR